MVSEKDLKPAKNVLDRIAPSGRLENGKIQEDHLIPILQELQRLYGYLPRNIVEFVSREGGIPLSLIFGVITFYAQFHTAPRGKHTVCCCRGTACHVKGEKRSSTRLRTYWVSAKGKHPRTRSFLWKRWPAWVPVPWLHWWSSTGPTMAK